VNSDDFDYTTNGVQIRGGAGAIVPVGNAGISLEAFFAWQNEKNVDSDDSYSGNVFGLSVGLVGFLSGQ
jgi:hypothetical protein